MNPSGEEVTYMYYLYSTKLYYLCQEKDHFFVKSITRIETFIDGMHVIFNMSQVRNLMVGNGV